MDNGPRLFYAVTFSTELQEQINQQLVSRIPSRGYSKTKPENLHLTLCFLGNQPETKIREMYEKVKPLEEMPSFEIELCGIGHFKQTVVWLGVGKGETELQSLSTRLRKNLGVPPEHTHAHVTLGRNKTASLEELDQLIEDLRHQKFEQKIMVRGFDLIQSTITSSGSIYRKRFSIEFT